MFECVRLVFSSSFIRLCDDFLITQPGSFYSVLGCNVPVTESILSRGRTLFGVISEATHSEPRRRLIAVMSVTMVRRDRQPRLDLGNVAFYSVW